MTTEIDAEGLAKAEAAFFDIHGPMSGFDKDALGAAITAYLATTRTSEAEPVAWPVLGYANLYRDKDGELELGATDLEPEMVSSFPNASEYMDFVGRVEVRLASGTLPTPASDDQVEAACAGFYTSWDTMWDDSKAVARANMRKALASMGSTKP